MNKAAVRRANSLRLKNYKRGKSKFFNICVFDEPKDDLHLAQFESMLKRKR